MKGSATNGVFCPFCENETVELSISGWSSKVRHCKGCGSESINPLPSLESIRSRYVNYQTTKTSEKDLGVLIPLWCESLDFYIHKAGMGQRPRSSICFLDIGFGNGASLFAAARLGLRAYGVDLDPVNVDNVVRFSERHELQVSCRSGDVASAEGWKSPFDLIKVSQVLEHVDDPLRFLTEVKRLQGIGGYLILDCPNNEAAFWTVKNRIRKVIDRIEFYNSLKLNEHLWGFTKKSLRLLLEKTGYEILFLRDFRMGDRLFQPETVLWYPTLGKGLRLSIRSRNLYPLLYSCVRVFDFIFSKSFGQGMGLVVMARRNR